ncbi:MAG: hypothetical protein Q9159_002326 [Coniocarpon cinnabarinum]
MHSRSLLLSLVANGASAFPWVASQPGVDSSLLRRQQPGGGAGSAANCPFNANHQPAAPVTDEYPYNNARNGVPGAGQGGILVPDPNDKAHQFTAPDYSTDIRGPCPGLNAAALSHDGVVTFNELVDAQQNVYNVGYDLAVLLAALGLTLADGDPISMKLSIGCDATSRTAAVPLLAGSQPGLDGHNKFEADSSLTRNDFFTHNGDDFSFNGTLFGYMQDTCQGNFNRENLSVYRKQRWTQSQAENENFYFGPLSLLLYGAASFLYELMPSGPDYNPDLPTISSFFGAQQNADGSFSFNQMEKIPDDWTTRLVPYSIPLVANEIFTMYNENPVPFGGNIGPGMYTNIDSLASSGGNFNLSSPQDVTCFLYQLSTERIPSALNAIITPTVDTLSLAASKLNPIFENLGCPIPLTKRDMAADWEAKMMAREAELAKA